MARALVNKTLSINLTESQRQLESNFSEQIAATNVGPQPVHTGSGEAVLNTSPVPTQINRWKAMTTVDEGLKQALYNWVNTTKDGVSVAPNLTSGRSKKLTFNFYGNIGKSIKPGEIGEFNLIFSYAPKSITPPLGSISIINNNNQS